jgi:GNAT superfamily N-acetyltransferase
VAPADFAADRGDAHLALVIGSRLAARCSLWWRTPFAHPGHRIGLIGQYAARDATAGGALLDRACQALAATGCTLAIGPMDGSTWRPYRFVTDRGTEPPFFLEPDHPLEWPGHFLDRGFAALARYRSTLNEQLVRDDPRQAAVERRLAAAAIAVRPLDLQHVTDDLRRIHGVVSAAFGAAPFFQRMDEDEFVQWYARLIPFVQPDLVLVAERGDQMIGFVFAVPDWQQQARGDPVDTIILKTVAVVPGRAHAGLGQTLATCCERRAAAAGYTRSIHALMADPGTSLNISRRHTRTIRRYALFARGLS